MKKQILAWALGLLVAGVCALLVITDKPEGRVAKDMVDHGVIRSTSDLQLIVKSNDLRENVFLFDVKSDGLVVAAEHRMPLRIRGVAQSNSEHGLTSLRTTLERQLNRVLSDKAHSVWVLEPHELWAVQLFLIEEAGRSFLVVTYY